MKEIYWNTNSDMLLLEELKSGTTTRYDQLPRAFINMMDQKISQSYPDQYHELCQIIGEGPAFAYGRVFQFSACNFSTKDGNPDVDDDGNFILERVSCPIRHICKRITCKCQITGNLSEREIQVIKLFASGFSEDELANRLFISKATVHNHITHIYAKLGYTGENNPDRHLVAYAFKNNLLN